jgi:MFS family permease
MTDPRRALPVLMAGTFMIVLDFFIVNVAMPSMQRHLHAGSGALEWVVAGYGLTYSALLIPVVAPAPAPRSASAAAAVETGAVERGYSAA